MNLKNIINENVREILSLKIPYYRCFLLILGGENTFKSNKPKEEVSQIFEIIHEGPQDIIIFDIIKAKKFMSKVKIVQCYMYSYGTSL